MSDLDPVESCYCKSTDGKDYVKIEGGTRLPKEQEATVREGNPGMTSGFLGRVSTVSTRGREGRQPG